MDQHLLQLIQPAILISVAAILIRFFGKVISDQKAFADDRNWEIELNGLAFFLKFIVVYGAVGFAITLKWNIFNHFDYWEIFVAFLFVGGWLAFSAVALGIKNYQIPLKNTKKRYKKNKFIEDFRTSYYKLISGFERIAKYVPLGLFAILFSYLLVAVYKSGNVLWLLIFTAEICPMYILFALIQSLRKYKPQKVNVYLIGQTEPILDILLLKVNNDNVRFRQGEKVVIMNRSMVEKIEIPIIKNNQKNN